MRRSKYGVRTDAAGKAARTIDGRLFASLAEARRYAELKLLERGGMISEITCQPRYPLLAFNATFGTDDMTIGDYVADFLYMDRTLNRLVIEDVKGMDTPLSKWKRKHCEAQYGITVTIIGPARSARRRPSRRGATRP